MLRTSIPQAGAFILCEKEKMARSVTVQPEVQILMGVIDRAIQDARARNITPKKKADAIKWLAGDYCHTICEWIFGTDHADMVRRWAEDGCPDVDTAWERRRQYWDG